MSQLQKLWGASALLATLLAIVMFGLIDTRSDKKKSFRPINSNLIQENADLKSENEQLKIQIADLKLQSQNLKTALDAYEKELLEVRQFLENAYLSYERRKVYLSIEDLKYVAPYEDKLFLNTRLEKFIGDSKKEAQKIKRRRINIVITAGIVLFLLMGGFTIWALNERTRAIFEKQKSQTQL